jgi:hypothetical protein
MAEPGTRSLSAPRRLVLMLGALAVMAVISGAGAHAALATNVEGYCDGVKTENQTCDSGSHHLDENGATTEGLGRVCIDEYLGYYTAATCSNGSTAQYPQFAYGYGRAWEQASRGFILADVVWE